MKELSIEEKAKAYDEVIKKAESLYKAAEPMSGCNVIIETLLPELKESEDERIRKRIIHALHGDVLDMEETTKAISWLEKQGEPQDKGEISDGYHTFNELYYYRMLYNAAFFNMLPKEWVHKSKKHHDGEDCFGGGWFIVMANLPTGQISNHYELKDWDLFQIPEKEVADKWDGHTPQEAADRLHKYLLEKQDKQPSAIRWYDVSLIPQEMEELLVEWDSEDATWHEIAFYHADTKTFWNGTRQVENVTKWCYIIDLFEKQGEQTLSQTNERAWLYLVSDVLTWKDGIGQYLDDPRVQELAKKLCSEYTQKLYNSPVLSNSSNTGNNKQKPANKVEPKFHEGEWITNGDYTWKIVEVKPLDYILQSQEGNIVDDTISHVDEQFHSFTIKDAKDGDVLAEDTCTFIIKKLNHDLTAEIYCCLYDDGDFELNSNLGFDDRCTYPATKEQRDLLFQKMKEAGYEWDAEKKEVRLLITNGGDFFESENCDQKPAEWKQENREELTEFENAMMHIGESFFGENAGLDPNDTNTIKEQAELLLKLAPKTEWNEEDEKNLQGIIDEIQANKNNAPSYDIPVYEGFLNWLKSRKQKIGG